MLGHRHGANQFMVFHDSAKSVRNRDLAGWRRTMNASGYYQRLLDKLMAVAAWACLAFITYVTLSPLGARPELVPGGSLAVIERLVAYIVLGFLFRSAYPRHLAFVCILVFGSAIVLELLQNIIPDRDARVVDVIEKLLGGAAGILLGKIVQSGFWSKTARVSSGRDT
jgi:glycopeptide antibiotics resistance protein